MKHRYLSGLLPLLMLAQISCGSAADAPAVTTGTDTTLAASETTVVNAPELPEATTAASRSIYSPPETGTILDRNL